MQAGRTMRRIDVPFMNRLIAEPGTRRQVSAPCKLTFPAEARQTRCCINAPLTFPKS
jgi:hypothetical protein